MSFRLRVFASNGNSHVSIDANLASHGELSVRLRPNPAEDASKPSANIGTCAPKISEILHHDEYMPKVRGVDLRWFEYEKRAAWAWMLQAGTPCLQQDHVDVLAWASKYAEWCLPDDFEATMNSQQPTHHVLEIASQASCSTPNFQQCQVSYSIRQPANGILEKRLIENHHNATYTINKDTAFWAETQSDQSTFLINSTWLAPSASPNWALSPSIQSPTLSLLPWALSAVWYLSHNFIVSFQSFHDLNTRNIPKWYPWWRRNCSRWPQSRDSSEASLCTFHIASLCTKVMDQNGTCGHRRKSQPILKHCHIAFNTLTSMTSRWQNWQNWQRKDSLKNPSYAMLPWSSAWPASCCSYDHLISASGSAGCGFVDLFNITSLHQFTYYSVKSPSNVCHVATFCWQGAAMTNAAIYLRPYLWGALEGCHIPSQDCKVDSSKERFMSLSKFLKSLRTKWQIRNYKHFQILVNWTAHSEFKRFH